MNSAPLSYDSLRTVIQHLEANLRFKVTARCPSIRNAERNVPLHINYLGLSRNYNLCVNETSYNLGIWREYRNGNTPKIIKESNEDGGLDNDLDKWGFPRSSYNFVKTPGDIVLSDKGEDFSLWGINENYEAADRAAVEQQINNTKMQLEEVKRLNRYDYPDPFNGFEDQTYGQRLEEFIEYYKDELSPYLYRQDNVKPPYDCFINFKITNYKKRRCEHIERVQYTRKLYEATKYLFGIIFGRGKKAVNVKTIEISCVNNIIRLPVGVKFKAQKVIQYGNLDVMFDVTLPIFNESCLPLKHVEVNNINTLDKSFLKNAKEITITHNDIDTPIIPYLLKMTTERVTFQTSLIEITAELQFTFIKDWLDRGRKAGTCFKISFKNEKKIMDILDLIERRLNERVHIDIENQKMIMVMKNSTELQISYEKETDSWYIQRWFLKMEVVSCGTEQKRRIQSSPEISDNTKRARIRE